MITSSIVRSPRGDSFQSFQMSSAYPSSAEPSHLRTAKNYCRSPYCCAYSRSHWPWPGRRADCRMRVTMYMPGILLPRTGHFNIQPKDPMSLTRVSRVPNFAKLQQTLWMRSVSQPRLKPLPTLDLGSLNLWGTSLPCSTTATKPEDLVWAVGGDKFRITRKRSWTRQRKLLWQVPTHLLCT